MSPPQVLDPEVTPPGQIVDSANFTSPNDPLMVTPSPALFGTQPTTQQSKATDSKFGSKRFRQKPTPAALEPLIFGPGVTGANPSIPIFDGTSLNPKDYLIDLETDSMETYPDIRSYFYWVGDKAQAASVRPVEPEERKIYDDKLVTLGREYLKEARARGHG